MLALDTVFAGCQFSSVVEQLICNQQVVGSSPTTGSTPATVYVNRVAAKKGFVLRFVLVSPFVCVLSFASSAGGVDRSGNHNAIE